MEKESVITPITRFTRIHYDAYASLPTTNLRVGEAGFATDRKVLYRWSGAAWVSIGISSRDGNVADIGDPADYPENSLYQATDEGLLYMVVSAAWVQITTLPGMPAFAVGDILAIGGNTERSTDQISYIKMKEISIATAGTIRICFDLKAEDVSYYAGGRVYKNGAAHGTERLCTSLTYVTYSEDLVFAAGDLVQLYCKCENASFLCWLRNFQLKADKRHVHFVLLD